MSKNSLLFFTFLLLQSCTPIQYFGANLFNTSSYDRYVNSIKKAGLLETSMGRDWLAIGEQVLRDTQVLELPFEELAYFASNRIDANAYRFVLQKGATLSIEIKPDPRNLLLFVDLFQDRTEDRFTPIPPQLKEDQTYQYSIRQEGEYVLRVQPQMLTGGRYEIVVEEE